MTFRVFPPVLCQRRPGMLAFMCLSPASSASRATTSRTLQVRRSQLDIYCSLDTTYLIDHNYYNSDKANLAMCSVFPHGPCLFRPESSMPRPLELFPGVHATVLVSSRAGDCGGTSSHPGPISSQQSQRARTLTALHTALAFD
jgi:hypothetical protein